MAQLKYLDWDGLQTFLNNINNTITEEVAAAGSQIEAKYGIANGVATLDASAKLVASQLPDITTLQVGTVGSTTQPVYFNNGAPTAIGYTIQKSVPANAIFTDTVYTLPNASDSTLGGIKTGYTTAGKSYAVKVDSSGNAYVDVAWTDTTYTLSSFGITTDATHINYVSDVTSNIQAQLNGKVGTNGTGATGTWGISITGNAASASKLNTNAGSANQPVYFANGVPVALNYTIQTSVPANAKFTDTTYSNATSSAAGLMSQTDKAKLDSMDSDIQNQVDGKAASNATFYIGTTQIALGRASAAQTLAGTSISGNAATATKLSSAGSINITGDVTASGVTYTNGGNVTLNATIKVYKDYVSYKFTEATTSYTIPSLSSYHNPDVEVFFNGFLLRPTIDGITGEYALDSETGVITFTNTLGGTGAEQELIIVIRSFQALPGRVATPVITVVN